MEFSKKKTQKIWSLTHLYLIPELKNNLTIQHEIILKVIYKIFLKNIFLLKPFTISSLTPIEYSKTGNSVSVSAVKFSLFFLDKAYHSSTTASSSSLATFSHNPSLSLQMLTSIVPDYSPLKVIIEASDSLSLRTSNLLKY